MTRVAIIGCGKIADQHVHAIHRISDSQIVAVCDREPLMARQLAERFSIAGIYHDVAEMLRSVSPDVVHITTPPQSHFALATQCIEAGCHVYLEKPFTVTALEAQTLIDAATRHRRHVAAGHNVQFTAEMMRMRQLVSDGFLGGPPVHVESYWSYDLGDQSYVGPILGDDEHWVRKLPGQLLHNIISHGIARIAEFLDDEIDEIIALGHQSKNLRDLGGQEVKDELRVLIRDRIGTTASFCFSTQMRPGLNQLRLFGPTNSITVDASCASVIRHWGKGYKSYLTFLVPPVNSAKEHVRNAWRNLSDIVRWRLYQDGGMKELIERFYSGISREGGPPIPYREVLLTARIMDKIFAQIGNVDHGNIGFKPIAVGTSAKT